MRALGVVVALAACGSHELPATAPVVAPAPVTAIDRMLPLLPDGAQIVVELDLARLRANTVVGDLAGRVLAQLGADSRLPGLPLSLVGSPLGSADAVVLAAYGVGTAQAATITVLASTVEVPNATRLGADLFVLGPDDWVGQVQARAAIAAAHGGKLAAPDALMKLRDHAMPAGATGAVVRITARLPFDARISLARQTGLDAPPAQMSVWADVADDIAVVVDADAADPGDGKRGAVKRLAATIRGALGQLADAPTVRALGIPNSISDARLIAQGNWVRTVLAVGPRHLARVVERARAMLGS